jgi:DNA repair exonuclease SbcCD ATPase subunit
MIKLQALAKARQEMELVRLNARLISIEEENHTLFKMQDERFGGSISFVPVAVIMKRLETNKTLQTQLSQRIALEKQNLLKLSRMLDTLRDRLVTLDKELQRTEAAAEMDECMGHLSGKSPF